MRKICTIIILAMMFLMLTTGCGGTNAVETAVETVTETTEEKEVTETPTPNNISIEAYVTERNFVREEENLKFKPDEGENTKEYHYNGYTFERFEDFLTVQPDGSYQDQLISGTDFILCEDEIWFINSDRNIGCFKYTEFKYPDMYEGSFDWRESKQYTTYQNADLTESGAEKVDCWAKYDETVDATGKTVAFLGENKTILFHENEVELYDKHKSSKYLLFPFSFKEIGLTERNYYNECDVYAFVSDTNTVGTITVYYDGTLEYNIITEGKDKERHLFHSTEENNVSIISLYEGWVIYYENSKLIGSNGEMHFYFDDMEYEEKWDGDCFGVGKGFENCYFLASYYGEKEVSVSQMVKETGINY